MPGTARSPLGSAWLRLACQSATNNYDLFASEDAIHTLGLPANLPRGRRLAALFE